MSYSSERRGKAFVEQALIETADVRERFDLRVGQFIYNAVSLVEGPDLFNLEDDALAGAIRSYGRVLRMVNAPREERLP